MSFVYTTAIRKLRKLNKRIRVVPGGTSAGKTYGILPILIDRAIKTAGLEISVVSETIPHLRRGAIKDFKKIMQSTGRWMREHWNETHLTYTFSNGSFIEFFSAEQEDKVRGPRRTHLYVNECNNITFETYHQLAIRTSVEIWLDFNPTHEFWVHTELKGESDCDWMVLTYKDNEGLPESIVTEIEKAKEKAKTSDYWQNWWNVYGLGQLGMLQGVVFSNWTQVDYLPEHANLIGYGMDFGYSNDPTTLVGIYEADGKTYLDELLYRKGMSNSDIGNYMKQLEIPRSSMIYADSADPKSIAELRTYGFSVMPAQKGKDSIAYGIQLMQDEYFHVTKRSTNMINEFRQYTWLVDKEGKTTNAPIDAFNHCVDSIRYFYQSRRKNSGQYMIR